MLSDNYVVDDDYEAPIKRTEEIKVCLHPDCLTVLNPYRAVYNKVCSIHVVWLAEEEDKKPTYNQLYQERNREKLNAKQRVYQKRYREERRLK